MGDERTGMVLLIHGSRDAAWRQPFEEMAEAVRREVPGAKVGLACLQLCHPDLEEALSEMGSAGVRRVRVVPVFISALGHALKDVPPAVARARARFPGMEIEVSGALGEQPEVVEGFERALVRLGRELGD